MSTSPSVFPFAHIALTAAIAFQGPSAGRLPAGRCGGRPLGHGMEIGGQYWGAEQRSHSGRESQ